jgi:hypothetical protein
MYAFLGDRSVESVEVRMMVVRERLFLSFKDGTIYAWT